MTNKGIFTYFAIFIALILSLFFLYFACWEDIERETNKKNFYSLANEYLGLLISEKKGQNNETNNPK